MKGKGYPDLSTKRFLKKISEKFSHIPFFYLGDYDTYGFDILLNYTFSNKVIIISNANLLLLIKKKKKKEKIF